MGADPPQAFVWAPSGASAWRRVDFVSDLHLSAALPRTMAAFGHYLRTTPADMVVILGDLFEVWVGDDARHGEWETGFVSLLASAAAQRPLAFMAGNRDFLAGSALLAATGLVGLPDPTRIVLFGEPVLLSHGDALCLSDEPYQRFRSLVRSAQWRHGFLTKPLMERRAIAAAIRSESRSRRSFDGSLSADLDTTETLRWLEAAGATTLLHGHTHRPMEHRLGDSGRRRLVLSDWDLDDTAKPRAEVLAWTASGPTRLSLNAAT